MFRIITAIFRVFEFLGFSRYDSVQHRVGLGVARNFQVVMLLNPKYSDNLRFAAFTIKFNNMALPYSNNLCPKDAVDSVDP